MPAHTEVGLGGGLAVQSDTHDWNVSFFGPVISGQLTRRLVPRFAVRGQAAVARFGPGISWRSYETAPCPFGVECPSRRDATLTVANAAATLLLFDDDATRVGRGVYYAFSGVISRPLQHPDGVHPVRPGFGGGMGRDFAWGRHFGSVELQYQRVHGFTRRYFALVPLTLTYIW
jgi:hypothetical protein